ncbi:MAG: GGDEF domain-containing protein, partial [Clostridia bacterium]|nr:GGDEF domain-containing protein [Clostridia bacterium]
MDELKYQIDLLTALNERLTGNERIYQLISDISGNAYVYFDYRTQNIELMGCWEQWMEDIVMHKYDFDLMISYMSDEYKDTFIKTIVDMQKNHIREAGMEFQTADKKFWIECKSLVYYDDDGTPTEKIVCCSDITKRKAQSEELEYLAYYDSLTGLYNRNSFVKKLRDMCERAAVSHSDISLMFVDIDDFKKINDSLGLLFGDELVQDFGMFIKGLQTEDIVAGRFGSDVFCIGIYNSYGSKSADMLYRKICERLRQPFIMSNKAEVIFTVSVGVATYPEAGKTALELIKNAEIVLFRAKENGKNNIQFFEKEILEDFLDSVSFEQRLKTAIDNEDFILYFQPQFYADSGKLRGLEALIRWIDNEGKFVSPMEFIPIAEKNGAIIPIGNWVIKEALRIFSVWKTKYEYPLILSINISALQLKKENFIDQLLHLIHLYEVKPEYIELEITESIFIDDFDEIIDKMKALRHLGLKVSLDDFGTGFSSLSYLRDLPIDTLKIDKSFIDTVINDKTTNIITESVVSMVKKLGLETVAEGVETQEQY